MSRLFPNFESLDLGFTLQFLEPRGKLKNVWGKIIKDCVVRLVAWFSLKIMQCPLLMTHYHRCSKFNF